MFGLFLVSENAAMNVLVYVSGAMYRGFPRAYISSGGITGPEDLCILNLLGNA